MVELSKFTSKKKKILSEVVTFSVQPNLLPNFVQNLITLGLKNFMVVTKTF